MLTKTTTPRLSVKISGQISSQEKELANSSNSKKKETVNHAELDDRGGTDLAMAQVSDAYEILMKPNLRKIYDRFGRRGLEALKTRK